MGFVAPMVGFICFVIMIGWVVTVGARNRRRRQELDVLTNLHNRLIDRLQSGAELTQFMESMGGARLLRSLDREQGTGLDRVLAALQAGIVLAALGLALLGLGLAYDFDPELFEIFGVILLGIGVGFLASAGLAYRLGMKFGVLVRQGEDPERRP